MTQFSDMGLAAPILKTLEALNYTTPTPIQIQSIPTLLEGRDLLGIAQTGTGKTAAFALPVLHHLNLSQQDGERPAKSVRALVLAPTRELAGQIADSCREYGKLLGLRINVVTGGVPLPRQIKQISRGSDLLIATPGRLEDLMSQRALTLSHVTHLVLDEADQMLDMGFIHVLKRIAKALPKERQTLLFSATMPKEIEALAGQFLRNPAKVSVNPVAKTADLVTQAAYYVPQKSKPVLLARLLKDRAVTRAIVFTRTKHGANRLVKQLDAAKLDALAIHGNKTQAQRQKALNAFRDGECAILVATDVAARGIDIPLVSHVFNYEIPDVPEQYVHRIGRTARAGQSGIAISLICDAERSNVRDIERLTKVKLDGLTLPPGFSENLADEIAEMASVAPDTGPGRRGDRFTRGSDSRGGDSSRRPTQGRPARRDRNDTPPPKRDRDYEAIVAEMGSPQRAKRQDRPDYARRDDAASSPRGDQRGERPSGRQTDRPARSNDGERRFSNGPKEGGDRSRGPGDRNRSGTGQTGRTGQAPRGDRPQGSAPRGDRPQGSAPRPQRTNSRGPRRERV